MIIESNYEAEIDGIRYNLNPAERTAEVTSGKYSGRVVIPSTVGYDDATYAVTSIGDGAFFGCRGLSEVTIPGSVASIGQSAFSDCCGLTQVTIPGSVTSIGYRAFDNCTSLTAIYAEGGAYVTQDGVLYSEGMAELIQFPLGKGGSFDIPDGVTSIGWRAFSGCRRLKEVTIPDSVTRIGYRAFCDCSGLTQVTIPSSVTGIGYSAFWDCSGLVQVTILNPATSIGREAFHRCGGLEQVTIGNSVITLED